MGDVFDTIIAGSGPAGIGAALVSARRGLKTLLLERQKRFGVKLCASGGTRCNLSNTLDDRSFMESFGREGRFMAPALQHAPDRELFAFLASRGVPVTAEDGFHYFPVSGKSSDILYAFLRAAEEAGAAFRSNTEVAEILTDNGCVRGIKTDSGETILCRNLLLACGGTAMRGLGGTGKGLQLASSVGHTILPPYPAMAPLLIADEWLHALAGISFPDARLSFRKGRKQFSHRGELLCTHKGFSGPCALDLAGELAETAAKNGTVPLFFQPDASVDRALWEKRLEQGRLKSGTRFVVTLLSENFPRSFAEGLCTALKIGNPKLCELRTTDRERLTSALEGYLCTAIGSGPMNEAMAMKGGVKLRETDPETLESRLLSGLFFAGEILNLTGPCGGYNIRWAFASGRWAAEHFHPENEK